MSINSQNLSKMPKKSFNIYGDNTLLYEIEEKINEEQKVSSSDIKKQSSEPYKSDVSNSSPNNSQKNNNLMSKLSNKPKQSPKSYTNN